MITPDGFVEWAIRHPGPAFKQYDVRNRQEGIVFHSMEGWLAGSFAELDKPERQASWMFSCSLDGTLYQHYPVWTSCWASGNGLANTHWWSLELEGVYTMPINLEQARTVTRVIAEWHAVRPDKQVSRVGDLYSKTLWEHREVDTLATPNAGDTACPSERYQPLWAALGEGVMAPEELELLLAIATVVAGPATGADFTTVGDALAVFRTLRNDDQIALLGLGQTQAKLEAHIASPHAATPHHHSFSGTTGVQEG